jgi:MFS superfamily sulfate permease-like transporter
LRQIWTIASGVLEGKTNVAALLVGASTLALILLLQSRPRIPAILIAVVAATLAVDVFDLAARAGVSVLGPLPQGLPIPSLPLIGLDDVTSVLIGGFAVALVSFADTSVLSRVYATRMRTPVDPNQEMVSLGIANLAAGFVQGFPISSSASRTPVAEAAGARTQLTGVVGALAILVLLVTAPTVLQNLPSTALAAVVIAAAIGLVEVSDLRRIYRIQRWEFWLSMTCFASVAVFGAVPGIAIAVVIAVIEFLWDGWRPHSAVLGRVDRVKGYHDISRYPQAKRIPGLVLFRWDAPLFFANAELFRDRVLGAVASSPTPVRWVVVAAEPVTSVDVTAADILAELDDVLNAEGIELCFAEMKDPVKDKLNALNSSRASAATHFTRRSAKRWRPTWAAMRSSGSVARRRAHRDQRGGGF